MRPLIEAVCGTPEVYADEPFENMELRSCAKDECADRI